MENIKEINSPESYEMLENTKNESKIKRPSTKYCLNTLRRDMLTYIFDYLNQNDFFNSVALVNKRFNLICMNFKQNLSFAELIIFPNSNSLNYDPKAFDHICQSKNLKKFKIYKKFYLNKEKKSRFIKYDQNFIFGTLTNSFFTTTIEYFEIDFSIGTLSLCNFLNSLKSLKTLKICLNGSTKEFLYLLKKFIDSSNIINTENNLSEFGEIVYHPLEKFYDTSESHWLNSDDGLLQCICNNKVIKVFESLGFDLGNRLFSINSVKIENNRSLKKFSVKYIEIEMLTEFIVINQNLEHLHFDLNLNKNCDSIANAIKNHPALVCLKINSHKNTIFDAQYLEKISTFFDILSGSKLKKIGILNKIIEKNGNILMNFIKALPLIEKIEISVDNPFIFNFELSTLPNFKSFNKIKRYNLIPNESGILQIKKFEQTRANLRLITFYYIVLKDIVLVPDNLKVIKYHNYSINLCDFPTHFLPMHKFYCDKLEDFYFIHNAHNNIDFKEAHFIFPRNPIVNLFEFIEIYYGGFNSLRILKIKLKHLFFESFWFRIFIDKFRSLLYIEEFYLISKQSSDYEFVESELNLPSLKKFESKNISFTLNHEISIFDVVLQNNLFKTNPSYHGLLHLNLSNSSFSHKSVESGLNSLKLNNSLVSLILKDVKIEKICSKQDLIPYFNSFMDLLVQKRNMEEIEITFDCHEDKNNADIQNKSVIDAFANDYLEFLKKILEKNQNLKNFNFFLFLPKDFHQEFIKIILKFCISNKNLLFLFGKQLNTINCFKVTQENQTDTNFLLLFPCLNDYPLEEKKSAETISMTSANFIEFLNEYKSSKLNYEFILYNELKNFNCQAITVEDYFYDEFEIKSILVVTRPRIINLLQKHLDELEKYPKLLCCLQPRPLVQIIKSD